MWTEIKFFFVNQTVLIPIYLAAGFYPEYAGAERVECVCALVRGLIFVYIYAAPLVCFLRIIIILIIIKRTHLYIFGNADMYCI